MSDDAANAATPAAGRPRAWLALLPLAVFAALAAIFLLQLQRGGDKEAIPSALIGKPVPRTSLPPLESTGLKGFESAALKGQVTVVNVWASWCAPCREEHPVLMQLAADKRFSMAGVNYKDRPENAARFLGSLGNPFSIIGRDENGRASIDWGVYGVPETFLVGKDGTVLLKHVGPLTPQAVMKDLMPTLEKALAAGSGS